MIHSVINLAPMTFSVVQMISGSLVFSAVLIGMISCGTCWNRLCRFGKNDSDRLRPSSQPELIKRQRKSNVEREGERRQSEFAPNKQQQETIGRIFDRPFSKRSYLNKTCTDRCEGSVEVTPGINYLRKSYVRSTMHSCR